MSEELLSSGISVPPAPLFFLHRRLLTTFGILAGIVLSALALSSIVYLRPPTDALVRKISAIFPYPAAVVDGRFIRMRDYLKEYDALILYYAQGKTAGALEGAALERSIVDTLVNKQALLQLAKERGITPDATRVDAMLAQAALGAPMADFEAQLKTQFGWSLEEFKSRVLSSVALASQMTEAISKDAELQEAAHDKAVAALARVEAGEDFAAVAAEVSEDESKNRGGDMGFVNTTDLAADPVYASLLSLQKNDLSAIIDAEDAYLFVKVMERPPDQFKLSGIVVNKKTLQQVVDQYLADHSVIRLIGRG